jgi:hypothetical protein
MAWSVSLSKRKCGLKPERQDEEALNVSYIEEFELTTTPIHVSAVHLCKSRTSSTLALCRFTSVG